MTFQILHTIINLTKFILVKTTSKQINTNQRSKGLSLQRLFGDSIGESTYSRYSRIWTQTLAMGIVTCFRRSHSNQLLLVGPGMYIIVCICQGVSVMETRQQIKCCQPKGKCRRCGISTTGRTSDNLKLIY